MTKQLNLHSIFAKTNPSPRLAKDKHVIKGIISDFISQIEKNITNQNKKSMTNRNNNVDDIAIPVKNVFIWKIGVGVWKTER